MKIGIDGNEANIDQKVGIHQYAYEILCTFYKLNQKKREKHIFTVYLKQKPNSKLPQETEWWKYKILKGRGLWILTKLTPELILNNANDVFFTPSHYLPLFSEVAKVCTIHDLGYLEFSEQFKKKDYYQLKLWTARSISISKKLIAVSRATKQDILKYYKVDPKKIEVVHHGYDSERFNTINKVLNKESVLKKYNISQDYLLYLGTLKPSKNIQGLIGAYNLLSVELKTKYKLVIAGMKGWMYEEIFRQVNTLKLEDKVIFTGYVDEKDKEALYYGAKLLVQPSFWEGFGMQVLDSMAMGTPVVISEVASLPEVGGNAAVYVQPRDIRSITKGMEKVLKMNEVQYNKLVSEGLEQVKQFSWEKAGKKTLEILESTQV